MDPASNVLNVLGIDIRFRSGAKLERARQAAQLVEDRYEEQKKTVLWGAE